MPREPPDPNLLHDIYIDESSQTNNRFLLLGGLVVPTRHLARLEYIIRQARLPELPSGELKWTKVSLAKLPAYRSVMKAVLSSPALVSLRSVEFHSLVIDTHKLKDKTYNAGSREVGFNKEIYQLCQKFGRINRTAIFHIYLDKRDTKSSTQKLRDILNFGIHGEAECKRLAVSASPFQGFSRLPLPPNS